jgi:hypothetical protein
MDLSAFRKFPMFLNGQDAYAGDLGERYHAVINQDTFVEVCTISTPVGSECWSGHIGKLKDNVCDLAEFKHALREDGPYYKLDTKEDVLEFLRLVNAMMVFDRP